MKDTVLITGGLGYVGGRVSQALTVKHEIKLLVGTHQPKPSKPEWVQQADIIHMDLTADASLSAACKGVDSVIHLAALNEIDSASDPEQALLVNTLGTLKLLRAAEREGVKRFIYFSTAHVYGSPLAGTITERTLPRPIHPYAITHKAAEDFVLSAHDKKILTGIILRLSNGFGAPAHPGINRWTLVSNDLCRQAVIEKVLILKSSGLQRRDFITLSDIARAVIHFLSLPASQCDNGIFNLGGENPLRIIDLSESIADRCKEVIGYRPPIIRPDPRPDEVYEQLDYRIDKLKATGFALTSNFCEEIDATLKLCQQTFAGKSR